MADTFNKEERAAMRQLAKERKLQQSRAESLASTLDRINSMASQDRKLAMAVHDLALKVYPDFEVKTWYGMPAYYKDGQVILFFQDGEKFKNRYCTVGFQQAAQLDAGKLWPTSYALLEVTPTVASELQALIQRALGLKSFK